MKNILIHCAMEKEGEQIAKFLELSKVQKYDTNLKNNSIKRVFNSSIRRKTI